MFYVQTAFLSLVKYLMFYAYICKNFVPCLLDFTIFLVFFIKSYSINEIKKIGDIIS